MDKIYILKIEESDLSQWFVGAVVSDNPMAAMQTLIDEVQSETNNQADLHKLELLEFPLKAA